MPGIYAGMLTSAFNESEHCPKDKLFDFRMMGRLLTSMSKSSKIQKSEAFLANKNKSRMCYLPITEVLAVKTPKVFVDKKKKKKTLAFKKVASKSLVPESNIIGWVSDTLEEKARIDSGLEKNALQLQEAEAKLEKMTTSFLEWKVQFDQLQQEMTGLIRENNDLNGRKDRMVSALTEIAKLKEQLNNL